MNQPADWAVRDFLAQRQMSDMFDDLWGLRRPSGQLGQLGLGLPMQRDLWNPSVDVREDDKCFTIHAEIPGVKKEDISCDLNEGVLTISGERKEKKKEENERYHRVERMYGKFSRSFTLPKNCDPNKISANYNEGVLELCLPKTAPTTPQSRKIDIAAKEKEAK